jgi:hypothetical protein
MHGELEVLVNELRVLKGPRFRRRVEAIVEHFSEMQADLNREKKAMTRLSGQNVKPRSKESSSQRSACMANSKA